MGEEEPPKDVFICYSFDDEPIATKIADELEARGVNAWIAPRDISGGKPWDEAIIEGIKATSGCLFLVSENANQSKQTKREIQLVDDFDKPIIPVTIEGTEPSERFRYYLASIQWVNIEDPPTKADYNEIAATVRQQCGLDLATDVEGLTDEQPSAGAVENQEQDVSTSAAGDRKPTHDESTAGPQPVPVQSTREDVLGIQIPRIYLGFGLALLSALTWGTGNVVTRWTAAQLPETSFDIAILKYILAGLFLVATGLLLRSRQENGAPVYRPTLTPGFLSASFFKGVNTYSWILASTLIPAGSVATLENLHVVWTALLLAMVFGRKIPGSWLAGAAIVVTGAALVTGFGATELTDQNLIGVTLAAVSGLTFALFTVTWTGAGEQADMLWKRSIEMGTLLLIAAMMIYPVHTLVSQLWLGSSLIPLSEIPLLHAVIQGINGLIGIGFTYFLMNEALSMTENLGRLSSLLIAIGLSFAVPLTMIVEFFILGEVFTPTQWMGVLLFILGFTAVRSGILEGDTDAPSEQPG